MKDYLLALVRVGLIVLLALSTIGITVLLPLSGFYFSGDAGLYIVPLLIASLLLFVFAKCMLSKFFDDPFRENYDDFHSLSNKWASKGNLMSTNTPSDKPQEEEAN